MKIKFPFKKSFVHRIYFYLCIGILLPIFACAAVELRTTPLKKERFAIFLAADLKPSSLLSENINQYFNGYNNKKITLAACDPSNSFFSAHYGSEGLLSDVIIMSQSAFGLVDFSLFSVIPENNEFYNDSNYINDEGKHLGIAFESNGDIPWAVDVDYKEENYYAFISSNSVHGKYFQEDCKDDQIMAFLRGVIGETR